MPNNDLEVFDHLCSDAGTKLEIDNLTFAMFFYRKSMWIEKFQSNKVRWSRKTGQVAKRDSRP